MHRRVRLAPSVVAGLAVLAFAAAVRAGDETDARIEANETTAVAALEVIRAAQERFKAARLVDIDGDGVGEYGLFRELSGGYPVRMIADGTGWGDALRPPVLPHEFSVLNGHSEATRSGYLFHMFLPANAGDGVREVRTGALSLPLNTDLAETTWCCYAWPESYGETGRRSFFTNQTGVIVATDVPAYSGTGNLAKSWQAGAAMRPGGWFTHITGEVAVDADGNDKNHWSLVTPRTRERRVRGGGPMRGDRYDAPKIGHCVLAVDRSFTRSSESLSFRTRGLRPGERYDVLLRNSTWNREVRLGSAVADSQGRLAYLLDSSRDALPSGVSTLASFGGGDVELYCRCGRYWTRSAYGFLPALDSEGAPEATGDRIADNELATVAALRQIADAQMQFRASAAADVDRDGIGEFGLFRELYGVYTVRSSADGTGPGTVLDPPVLPARFGVFDANSEVVHSGYLFHMILPGFLGIGVVDTASGPVASPIDSDLAETTWCCYAWPQKYGVTGKRTYFINQEGTVTTTEAMSYSGTGAQGTAAIAGAAFRAPGAPTSITGQVAICSTGRDGNLWRNVIQRPDDRAYTVSGALTPTASDSAAGGKFAIESRERPTADEDRMSLRAHGFDTTVSYRVVLTTEAGTTRIDVGPTHRYGWAPEATMLDREFGCLPPGIDSLRAFGGGTVELLDGDTAVLRGAIPRFATLVGPNEPGASLTYRADVALGPGPHLRLKLGRLEVRATADADGTREKMTLTVTTFDRLAGRADVVAVAGDVETPLGTIRLAGDRGAGVLQFDTSRGDAIPGGSLSALAGQRVEVRDTTGAVLLTGTFPTLL